MATVYQLTLPPPLVCRSEILRYAGVRGEAPELSAMLDECLAEALPRLCYKVCYAEVATDIVDDSVDLGFCALPSRTLARALSGCERTVVFAATVGLELDRLIARGGVCSPAKALLLDAIGAERVEALCDALCEQLSGVYAARGLVLRPRVSAGYGDIPLSLQRDIFALLQPSGHIGLALNEGGLMSPSKSVTAFVGLAKREEK